MDSQGDGDGREGLLRRLHAWLSTLPAEVDEDRAELYAVINYAMVVGWLAYLAYMPLFVILDVGWIVWVNVGLLVLISGALAVAKSGRSFEGFIICALCVLGHSSLMTLVLGWTSGFHFHIITLLQLMMLFGYVNLYVRLSAALLGATVYMALWYLGHGNAPQAQIPRQALETLGLLNLGVFLIITSGLAAYHSWVVRQHQLQLAEARDDAQEASRAKSAFLANMSHELRTPLNAIIGYSDLILEEAEDAEEDFPFTADVDKVARAGRHLLDLINDILDISKIEAGRMELDIVSFDLGALARQVVDTATPLARNRGNTLELELHAELDEFTSDPTKVRQILLNLISNACKFTSDGTVTLALDSVAVDGRPGVRICVRDTGIGIEPEALERIFEEFSQADSSTTRQFGGTGLGLTISRSFSRMLDGAIEVSSEREVGSTFTVCLPSLNPTA